MIHYLPLERIETRYTAHLDDSITAYLHEHHLFIRYYPKTDGRAESPPPSGRFLNATGTIEFKTKQIALLARRWNWGGVKDGDLIFTSDLWHPGIESVGYMSHFTGVKTRLRGLLWAGTFTDHDLIQPIRWWGEPYEQAILNLAEKVFVGSEDEALSIHLHHDVDILPPKLVATGMPLDARLDEIAPAAVRDNIVAWNGRITPEKQPELILSLATAVAEQGRVANVTAMGLAKLDYYRFLARCKVVVSFALEETFGFAVQEAVKLGCVPVLPNRLCYPEQFPPEYLYDDWPGCVRLVQRALAGELPVPPLPSYDPLPLWFAGC